MLNCNTPSDTVGLTPAYTPYALLNTPAAATNVLFEIYNPAKLRVFELSAGLKTTHIAKYFPFCNVILLLVADKIYVV